MRMLQALWWASVFSALMRLSVHPPPAMQMQLAAGKYVIVPMTFRPDKGCKFALTVQGNKEFQVFGGEEVDFNTPEDDMMEDDMTDEFQQLKVGQVEVENDIQETKLECNVRSLQSLVNELTMQAKILIKRKADLEERLRKLELGSQ